MKKMKKTLLFLLLIGTIVSCNDDESINAKNSEIRAEKTAQLKFDLIELKEKYENEYSKLTTQGEDLFSNDEDQALSIYNSINLLNSFNITNEDIINEFGSLDDPSIITAALSVVRIEHQREQGFLIVDFEDGYNYTNDTYLNINSLNWTTNKTIADCAMEALGLPAGLIVGAAGSTSTKALLKAARKLATRLLGWIGAGVAVYEFGGCMDWW